jgi:hypothetical protein
MPTEKPHWLVDLKALRDELRERDDELVAAGLLAPVRPTPTLTLIRGGRRDA